MIAQTLPTLALLGDESRLRLCALLRERELSVGDLVRVTGIAQSRVSTHLARLREGGLVRDRRDGAHAFYALASGELDPLATTILERAVVAHDPLIAADLRRLNELERERRGSLPEAFAGEMERHYSPGRTWQSLALGLSALLQLGDVLDLGCGDGAAAQLLAPACRSLTCVDASPRMVDAAAKRFAGSAHVTVRIGDGAALDLGDDSFDTVLLFHTLVYAREPAALVREAGRVLKPGGRLVALSLDEHEHAHMTAAYGERHPGLSPKKLRAMLGRSGLVAVRAELVCREPKKPHFGVVLATAEKPRLDREKVERT